MENVRDRSILEFIPHSEYDRIVKRQSNLSFKGIVNHYSNSASMNRTEILFIQQNTQTT